MSNGNCTIHMIGNGHIDPVWLWRWPEGGQTIRATFQKAIQHMEDYPQFIFTASSAFFFQWIEEVNPELFHKIRKKVKEGKWCLVGGWWIEPDCNIPGGEALVRQGLYGQRYFLEKFGTKAKVGYNPDSFGHNLMIPQILKKMGIDYYVFMRPGSHEKDLPSSIFWWQSPDGSRVLSYRIPVSYSTRKTDLKKHIQKVVAEFEAEGVNSSIKTIMCFYGAGDHGGGPTKEDIEFVQESNRVLKQKLLFSSPNRYFEEVSTENFNFPVIEEDLQHHASGCYAALSWIKKSNRELENYLVSAEKFSILITQIKNKVYPQQQLTRAWQLLLFTQFHDILAGTSIPEAYKDVEAIHGEVKNIAKETINSATQAIAGEVNTEKGHGAILVFNPTSWQRKVPVEIELQHPQTPFYLVDEGDNPVSFQYIRASSTTLGAVRICFLAELPSLGYTSFKLVRGEPEKRPAGKHTLSCTSSSLENDWFYLEIDPETGYIKKLYDKANEKEVFHGPAAIPVVIDDPSDTWSHGVFRFKKEVGRFNEARIKLVEEGPVRGILRIKSKFENSTLTQDMIMYRGLEIIECKVTVNWHERQRLLKLSFPVNVENPEVAYQIPYGFIHRPPNGEEEPGLSWIDVSGKEYGVSLINNAKYSYDVEENDLRLTVLRSPVYAHHIPEKLEPEVDYTYVDQGEQRFTYLLLPHPGSCDYTRATRWAENLDNPPISLFEHPHDGKLPGSQSFLKIDKRNILVSTIKKAEDTDDIVLRVYETEGSACEKASITFLGKDWKFPIGVHEIKTFLIPQGEKEKVREVNLLEL